MIPPFSLLLISQVAVVPNPSPPPQQEIHIANDLKRSCMSDEGIAIAMESWRRVQASARARRSEYDAIVNELGEAAYTVPIDVDRLERAARARDEDQAARLAENRERSIEVLRRLSPADREIYARRLSIRKPLVPVDPCRRSN